MTEQNGESRRADGRLRGDPDKESWLLRTGLSLCVWTLAGVATILAATGQVEFARWAGITDLRAYAVPAVLELVAVAFLLIGYRRARRGDSASMLWLLAAVVGGFAVYTNVVHSGGRSGLVFGAASAITMLLWFAKLRDDYRHFQRHTGQATRPRPKLGALWLVAPRLSTRAWVVATRRRISTVDEAVGYAEVWRAVYEDARTANVGRRLARRTAWQSVAAVAGGVYAELPRTAEIAAVRVLNRDSAPRDHTEAVGNHEPRTAVGPARDHTDAIGNHEPRTAVGPAPPHQQERVVGPHPAVAATSVEARPAASAAEIRDRVHSFLDSQVGVDDYPDAGDGDDPYLQWLTAQGLGLDVDVVAPHVREWCRWAADRRDPYRSNSQPFDLWQMEGQQLIPPNHRAARP